MSEHEVYNNLVSSGFFDVLGYKSYGIDIRSQVDVERKKPDYYCLDEQEKVVFVLEVKRPSETELRGFLDELWRKYVLPLRARYGMLTNGLSIMLYERIGENWNKVKINEDLEKITAEDCEKIIQRLQKIRYTFGMIQDVQTFLEKAEPLSLKEKIVREEFLNTFSLRKESPFGMLIQSLMKLYDEALYERKSEFLNGAYKFWLHSFAKKPEKTPKSWSEFVGEDSNDEMLYKFMFCLETAHILVAKLILAKACQDQPFPNIEIKNFITNNIPKHRDRVILIGWPIVIIKTMSQMRSNLVSSIFEEDIFSWWVDSFRELVDELPWEIERRQSTSMIFFSETLRKITLILLSKYNFFEITGDLLGDLYQKYFDRETRKALGEFYTPEEVVEYILDSLPYKNVFNKRLIDPACGSGTFIVSALKRYLAEAGRFYQNKWALVLKELCNSPKTVGLDIHPFACLMAQIRFMMSIIVPYKYALEQEPEFRLERVPIFRTDSLTKEIDAPLTEMMIEIPVNLPLKFNGELPKFNVRLPHWSEVRMHLNNFDEYFTATLALFDAVKDVIKRQIKTSVKIEVQQELLERFLKEYFSQKDFRGLAGVYKPYADELFSRIINVHSEYGDSRLVKSIEDSVLATILKALKYDFV
ncbi:MAG: N-6 DNA methylase, partial [archaeon]|nr:N-6 DNA methylase [archaeon]